jgi:NAD(P)-dependent dehydrogenase (short-subunit alcohol dehydrogenase family)
MVLAQLESKTGIVTGASAGIGRATALALAAEGARLLVADTDVRGGEETVRLIGDQGGEAVFAQTDVSSPAAVTAMVDRAVERFGGLDFAFNNAGIEGEMATTVDCTEANWDRVLAVNLKSVWLCMRSEIPRMLERGGGSIVNCASVAGLVGFRNLPAYCASKGGIVELSRATALEYATEGVRVNSVCPGVIHTAMVDRLTAGHPEVAAQLTALEPLGRMGEPEEIAAGVVWLCSDGASFVTGQAIAVDGGFVAQ